MQVSFIQYNKLSKAHLSLATFNQLLKQNRTSNAVLEPVLKTMLVVMSANWNSADFKQDE